MRILWIPHTAWHIPQRAHLFCRALAERHEVHVTDWVADFSSLSDYFSRRYLRNFTYRRYRDGRIRVHGVPRISPALPFRTLRRLNTAIFSRLVAYLIKRYAIDVVVGSFVVPPPKAPRLVFDLFDDNVSTWRAAGGSYAAYADEIEETQRRYLQVADAVVAASSVLAESARAENPDAKIYLIPNGVDLQSMTGNESVQVRKQLNVQNKLIGSVGNHDQPAELDKILDAAKLFTKEDVTFMIAGRGAAVPVAKKRVQREGIANVMFHGYVPYHQVFNMVSALDIGLCPYLKTPMDDARSPMRLLLYTAAGLPTVCTQLEEVRRLNFSNVLLVEDNANSLAEGINQALHMPRVRPPQIDEFDLTRLTQKYEEILCQ